MPLLAEEFIGYLFKNIAEDCSDELDFLSQHFKGRSAEDLQKLGSQPFGRLSYTDAIKELQSAAKKFEYEPSWGVDLQTEHERYLAEVVFQKPLIVTDYPKDIKAFYMRLNSDEKTVAAMDILAPGIGEIVGGAQREERLDVLKRRMQELNVDSSEIPLVPGLA